jgi:hypothetical protein
MEKRYNITVGSLEVAKQNAVWGTYGKSGKEPLHFVRLIDCTTDHLQAILDTQEKQTKRAYVEIIKSIIKDRTGQRYKHDCKKCIFLGQFQEYDLYFCHQTSNPTVLARHGVNGWEYQSGLDSTLPALTEARLRAIKLDLL